MRIWRVIKPFIGVVLIASSIFMLYWWENTGRQKFLMEERFVASRDIFEGEEVSKKDFKLVVMNEELIQKAALTKFEMGKVFGKVAKKSIRAGEQLYSGDFVKREDMLKEGTSIYVLKSEWLDSRSCGIRKGDTVSIYDASGINNLGSYKLAHVKNEAEQEVVNQEGFKTTEISERDFASSTIDFVEIFCTHDEYKRLYEMAENSGEKFLLVQEV